MHIYSNTQSSLSQANSTENKSANSCKWTSALRVALVGASGYSGMELGRCLLKHPGVQSLTLIVNETSVDPKTWIPEARRHSLSSLSMASFKDSLSNFDLIFLATPAEVSMDLVPQFLAASPALKVIDLSGAFRLKTSDLYSTWYGFKHTHPELLLQAHYGLMPFHAAPQSHSQSPTSHPQSLSLIANPGCYATAVQMALIPLLKSQLIKLETMTIDAKSGTSGAGKKASIHQLFAEVAEDSFAYRIGKHQHLPEIQHYLMQFSGAINIDPIFSTTLLPIRRGLVAAIYARLNEGVTALDIEQAYARDYENYPLVYISSAQAPEAQSLLSLKSVVGSARTHIVYSVEGAKLQLYSHIDNLMKGAATQAIENMNYLNNWPLNTGLTDLEGLL